MLKTAPIDVQSLLLVWLLALTGGPDPSRDPSWAADVAKMYSEDLRLWGQCVRSEALRLEPSGADALVIFEGAVGRCASTQQYVLAAMILDQQAKGRKMNAVDADSIFSTEIIGRMRPIVIGDVLNARAARASPK